MDMQAASPVRQRSKIKRILILAGLVVAFFATSLGFELGAAALDLPLMGRVSAGQAALMLVVVAFALLDGDGFRSLGTTARWEGYDFAAVPGLLVFHFAASTVAGLVMQKMGWMPASSGVGQLFEHFGSYEAGPFLLYALILAAQAGIGEELLFRGYLITRLEKLGLGALGTILGSALLFGLIHWPGYGLAASLSKAISFGLPAGAYFYYRRNLGPLMLMHTLTDYIGFTLAFALAKFFPGLPGL